MTFDDFWLWLTGRTWKKKEITSSGPLFQDGIMSSCVSKSTYWLEFGNPNWEMVIAPHGECPLLLPPLDAATGVGHPVQEDLT